MSVTCGRSVVFSEYSGFPINRTDRHDIAKILFKVALNIITLTLYINSRYCHVRMSTHPISTRTYPLLFCWSMHVKPVSRWTDMLVSKQLCSVNVDKRVNMQKKIHKQKHTHTHKIQQTPPKTTNKNNNKKTTTKQQTNKQKQRQHNIKITIKNNKNYSPICIQRSKKLVICGWMTNVYLEKTILTYIVNKIINEFSGEPRLLLFWLKIPILVHFWRNIVCQIRKYSAAFNIRSTLHGVHVHTVSRKSLNRAGVVIWHSCVTCGYISRNNIFFCVVKSLRNVIELTVQIYCKQQTSNFFF